MGRRPGVTLLNLTKVFLESDGTLSREVMPDYLHPSAMGYARWAAAMEPTLARLMDDTVR